jgi:hypothetical protein
MRRVDRSVVMTATVVMGSYRPLPEPPKFASCAAKAAKTLKLRTPAKLYIYETLLKWLAYNLKHIALEFGSVVSALKPVMGQGRQFRGRAAGRK